MKRFFLFSILLMSSILLFSGCRFFKKEPAIPSEQTRQEFQLEKKTGMITIPSQPLFPDTYLFTGDMNEQLSIRSGSINLRKYLKRSVEVEGKKTDDGIFQIESIRRLGREDDTRETYRNTRLGFSVQYVSLWDWIEKENETLFIPYLVAETEPVDRIMIARTSNEKRSSPEKWLDLDENYKSRDPADDAFYTQVLVGPDQIPGVKRTSKDGTRIDFYLSRENYMYRLTHITVEDEDEDKYRNVFFEMVNSFQFVAFDGVASVTTIVPPPIETPRIEIEAIQPTKEESKEEPEVSKSQNEIPALYVSPLEPYVESRGLRIKIQYPKRWYWEQAGAEIQFSDKPLEEGGTVLMRLGRGHVGEQHEPKEAEECTTLSETLYCLSVIYSSDITKNLMTQMIPTLSSYEP